jgi:hypothetical protein
MTSKYEEITQHNERQLGLDTASRKTQICMYSDSTHFIYEILQNADDYGATEISFKLTHNELIIEHNGLPFTDDNVKAITYFGKSTSRDDLVKTGRFGVGFKSVFAFTATPIIISGKEHFRIHGLYRVSEYPYPEDLPHNLTRIVLPFNHGAEAPDYVEEFMTPDDAFAKIQGRLKGLNMNSLLFTRNIREIRWSVVDSFGHYIREDNQRDNARFTTITDGSRLNRYLVFARSPTWHGQQHKQVEIALGLDEKNQISAIQDYLYVLFSTAHETHLYFIINGPYRTNPSRETIAEDDPFNCHLMKETCTLLGEMLLHLKNEGFLTVQCLSVFPNPGDGLRPFYAPLMDTVVNTFRSQNLVPTDDDDYATATSVMQGPAALREVVTTSELEFLTNTPAIHWAKGASPNSRPDLFLKGLKIRQWGWGELQEVLDEKYGMYCSHETDANTKWLAARSDEWMQKLYVMLADAIRKGDCDEWELQSCQLIRVVVNNKEEHVAGRRAYFPKNRSYGDLPQIKKSVLGGKSDQQRKRIEEALISLGVKEIGEEERIDLILDTFYSEGSPYVGRQQHIDHMRIFVGWWRKNKDIVKFNDRTFFKVSGCEEFKEAAECYMDAPLKASGLSHVYGEPKPGIKQKHKLWARYKELTDDGFCDFAIACGVSAAIQISVQQCYYHPNQATLRQDYNKYGTRYTDTAIDHDYIIPGLPILLKLKDIKINGLIWRTLCNAKPEVLQAEYRPNKRYQLRQDKSSLVLQLKVAEWIPDANNVLRKPVQLSKETLHPDFKYDNRNGWLDEIGFGEEKKLADQTYQKRKEMALAIGIKSGIVDILADMSQEEQVQFEEMLIKQAAARRRAHLIRENDMSYHEALAAGFHKAGKGGVQEDVIASGASCNPARRQEKLAEEIANAIESEPSPETRFTFGICKKWKSKDDVVRVKLLSWYSGKCQICSRTFIQRNGQPYFEGLYLVPRTRAEWIDRPGNVICLCPWHSAMFQFGRNEYDGDIVEKIMSFVPKAMGGKTDPALKFALCGENITLRFSEDHFLELQVMARESLQGVVAKQ